MNVLRVTTRTVTDTSSACARTAPCLLWRRTDRFQTPTRSGAPAQTAAWMPGMSAGRPWLRARARSGHVAETTSAHPAYSAHQQKTYSTLCMLILAALPELNARSRSQRGSEQEKCACSVESVQFWLHKRRREVALDGGKSAERQLNAGTQLHFEVVLPVPSMAVSGGKAGARPRWSGMPWELSVRWASTDFVTVSSWVGLSAQRSGFVGTAKRETGDKAWQWVFVQLHVGPYHCHTVPFKVHYRNPVKRSC